MNNIDKAIKMCDSSLYIIRIYDKNRKLINEDYKEFSDENEAKQCAEKDTHWLHGRFYEVQKIR